MGSDRCILAAVSPSPIVAGESKPQRIKPEEKDEASNMITLFTRRKIIRQYGVQDDRLGIVQKTIICSTKDLKATRNAAQNDTIIPGNGIIVSLAHRNMIEEQGKTDII